MIDLLSLQDASQPHCFLCSWMTSHFVNSDHFTLLVQTGNEFVLINAMASLLMNKCNCFIANESEIVSTFGSLCGAMD